MKSKSSINNLVEKNPEFFIFGVLPDKTDKRFIHNGRLVIAQDIDKKRKYRIETRKSSEDEDDLSTESGYLVTIFDESIEKKDPTNDNYIFAVKRVPALDMAKRYHHAALDYFNSH